MSEFYLAKQVLNTMPRPQLEAYRDSLRQQMSEMVTKLAMVEESLERGDGYRTPTAE